ncbi:chromate efflux transporter [Pseudooceanicola sp. MF1-13]|uniref:chromate efflux transporter n=1 Tax=Pseudooceanicola sp. MF1-13 TaxID=3379095 RepID=UPI003891A03B
MSQSWTQMFRAYGRIGALSFGGPAAQIALMHEELVTRRKAMSEQDFLGALSFCMLLPGPEAMQMATYAGWKERGVPGGLLAGLLFTLPGAVVIAALAFAYASFGDVPLVQAGFAGIKALVVVIVLQALWRISNKALKRPADWGLAAAAFIALFALGLPFPLIILAAGIFGYVTAPRDAPKTPPAPPAQKAKTLRTILIWTALWAAPLIPLLIARDGFLLQLSLFYAKLAVVTFGGAYAVLSYMAQAVVETYGWLSAEQMIDALGLAETTPGPLILVTQFTAHLAGMTQGGPHLAALAGVLALWMTFVPCFLWIFAFAPHVDRLLANPRLKGALAAITAAVVGVILNLCVWFALHVIFAQVDDTRALPIPDLSSIDPWAIALIILGALLLIRFKFGLLLTLALMALAGIGLHSVVYNTIAPSVSARIPYAQATEFGKSYVEFN